MCSGLWATLFSFWAFCKVKLSFVLKCLILLTIFFPAGVYEDGGLGSCGMRQGPVHGGCLIIPTNPIDFHADGWISQMLCPFLFNSLGFRQGQGQSNSHQLFWFFSGMLVHVVAAFILISEINERERVQGILGNDCCCDYERRVKASWQRRGGGDVAWKRCREHNKFWMRCTALTRLCTQVKWRTSTERRTLETHARIYSQKGNIWKCEMAWKLREGNYSRMRDVQFAPRPRKQHNRVIKSDIFARNFGNGIGPSLCASSQLSNAPITPPVSVPVPNMKSIISLVRSTPWAPDPVLLFSICHEYEFHDVDYTPDYRTTVFLLPRER